MTSDYMQNDDGIMNTNTDKSISLNIIDEGDYLERVHMIFEDLSSKLNKSYGPYGSHSIIINGNDTYMTKDGYTIANTLYYRGKDQEVTRVANVIRDMIFTICGRLNSAVGDGTTTAVKITNAFYQKYYNDTVNITSDSYSLKLRPADIISLCDSVKDDIIKNIKEEAYKLDPSNIDDVVSVIEKVVNISSNGKKEIADNVVSAYKAIGYPAVQCVLGKDNINTRVDITKGYRMAMRPIDHVYDDSLASVGVVEGINVLLFGYEVSVTMYTDFIRPLMLELKKLNRMLLIAAPTYSSEASYSIKADVMRELNSTHKIFLFATKIPLGQEREHTIYSDLSILLDTEVITRGKMKKLLELVNKYGTPLAVTDVCIKVDGMAYYDPFVSNAVLTYDSMSEYPKNPELETMYEEVKDHMIHIGYAGNIYSDGDHMVFQDMVYNEDLYNKLLLDIETEYIATRNRYIQLGTFSFDLDGLMRRFHNLKMNIACIAVSGNTAWKRDLDFAQYVDCVRAAESTYYNGYTLGCGVSVISVLRKMYENEMDENRKYIINLLYDAYVNVYSDIISSDPNPDDTTTVIDKINYSIDNNTVYDIITHEYSDNIINSAATDTEIIRAVVELISLLISGNQVIIERY